MWYVVLSAVAFGQATDMDLVAAAEVARLIQVMTAAIMPKAFKAGFMVLALLLTFVTFTVADCPDAGIRCRIPASDADTMVRSGLPSLLPCTHAAVAAGFQLSLCASRGAVLAAAEVGAPPVELWETCPLA